MGKGSPMRRPVKPRGKEQYPGRKQNPQLERQARKERKYKSNFRGEF